MYVCVCVCVYGSWSSGGLERLLDVSRMPSSLFRWKTKKKKKIPLDNRHRHFLFVKKPKVVSYCTEVLEYRDVFVLQAVDFGSHHREVVKEPDRAFARRKGRDSDPMIVTPFVFKATSSATYLWAQGVRLVDISSPSSGDINPNPNPTNPTYMLSPRKRLCTISSGNQLSRRSLRLICKGVLP